MLLRRAVVVVVLFNLGCCAAQISLEELKSNLPGHTIAMRVPFKGSEIFFDLDGNPIQPFLRGTLGRDGFISVSEVSIDERGNVILNGHRATLISFSATEPLQPLNTKEKVRIGLVVSSTAPEALEQHLHRVLHLGPETSQLIARYNAALKEDVTLDGREIKSKCEIKPTATPVARTLVGKRIQTRVIINELGEPDAIAFRTSLKKSEKEDAVLSLWNWRFAPIRVEGKLVSCSHSMLVDTTRMSLVPRTRPMSPRLDGSPRVY